MVQLTRIYTKGGDKGKTSLGNGERILKSHIRMNAIGTVDEANAMIGWTRIELSGSLNDLLRSIQNDLFDLGADLCMPEWSQAALRITNDQATALEKRIDDINSSLEPLNSFILPGGSEAAARLHLARTVVRRAERDVVRLHSETPINPQAIKYLNRLSDLLFVLCRHVNKNGVEDVLWIPGANREAGA
jgi:cob(I)alamin adenosyltransferase